MPICGRTEKGIRHETRKSKRAPACRERRHHLPTKSQIHSPAEIKAMSLQAPKTCGRLSIARDVAGETFAIGSVKTSRLAGTGCHRSMSRWKFRTGSKHPVGSGQQGCPPSGGRHFGCLRRTRKTVHLTCKISSKLTEEGHQLSIEGLSWRRAGRQGRVRNRCSSGHCGHMRRNLWSNGTGLSCGRQRAKVERTVEILGRSPMSVANTYQHRSICGALNRERAARQ